MEHTLYIGFDVFKATGLAADNIPSPTSFLRFLLIKMQGRAPGHHFQESVYQSRLETIPYPDLDGIQALWAGREDPV